jgi:hypothetical protein
MIFSWINALVCLITLFTIGLLRIFSDTKNVIGTWIDKAFRCFGGTGILDVPNSDFVFLTGGTHHACGPHGTSGALQGWHVRGSMSVLVTLTVDLNFVRCKKKQSPSILVHSIQ